MSENAYKFYVGMDVSKVMLDVAISTNESILKFSNNEVLDDNYLCRSATIMIAG